MATIESVLTKISNLISKSNAATGKTDTDLTTAVDSLIAGFGTGTGSGGGGVTPTGTISITANGTHDVTNYATANVNVPAPAENCVTRQITISADQGNGTASTINVLSGDTFVKEHYSHTGFSITMVPLFTPEAEAKVVSFVWHGNRVVAKSQSSYTGIYMQSAGTSAHSNAGLNTSALTGTTYTVGFRVTSAGNVDLHTRAASIVKAGNYMLILTCTD